jgi:L-rhamnose mutarotase
MSQVRRIAQIVHLRPSAVVAYKECHANVWPEVLQQIKDCNIKDCMISAFQRIQLGIYELISDLLVK